MHQSEDNFDTPRLDFEAWRDLLRSNCGVEVEVADPKTFSGWMRFLDVSGLAAATVKIQWGPAAVDLGCNAHRVERTHRDVRLYNADHYLILYQLAGQSALTQNDQSVQLAVGDVALVDSTRPVTADAFPLAVGHTSTGTCAAQPGSAFEDRANVGCAKIV